MTRTMTNEELEEDWLDWLRAGNLSPNTIRNRKYTLATFAATHELTTATTQDVLDHLRTRHGGAWSRAGHLAALRSFYRYGVGMGLVEHDPTAMIRSIKVQAKPPEPVPRSVLDRAILLSDPRTRFMLLLGSRAGLRREEIATLHSSNVTPTHLVIVGKGDKQRRIPIHPDLRPYLDELTPGWAFPSHVLPGHHISPETVQRAVTKAMGGEYTTHALRRYFATSAYRATKDLRTVQALLGHSDPMTTARYVQADDDAMTAAVLAVA